MMNQDIKSALPIFKQLEIYHYNFYLIFFNRSRNNDNDMMYTKEREVMRKDSL